MTSPGPRLLLPLALALLAAPGCMLGRISQGAPFPDDKVARIERGKTTKREILDWFGPPVEFKRPELIGVLLSDEGFRLNAVDRSLFSDAFTYQFEKGYFTLWSLILFTYTTFEVKHNLLVVFFGKDDLVQDFAVREQVPDP